MISNNANNDGETAVMGDTYNLRKAYNLGLEMSGSCLPFSSVTIGNLLAQLYIKEVLTYTQDVLHVRCISTTASLTLTQQVPRGDLRGVRL